MSEVIISSESCVAFARPAYGIAPGRYILNRVLIIAWIGLLLSNVGVYFGDAEDLLFFDRLLIAVIALGQAPKLRKLSVGPALCRWPLLWIGFGVALSLSGVFVMPSTTLRIYGTLISGMALGWRIGGDRLVPELARLGGALAIMTYPPKAIFSILNHGARDLSLWLTRSLAQYLLPEFHFHRDVIQHAGSDLLIRFAVSCSGFQFFLTYFALSLLLWDKRLSVADAAINFGSASLCALFSNVARVLTILFLVKFGYVEAALDSMHAMIGHAFMAVGLVALLAILERAKRRHGSDSVSENSQIPQVL